MSSFSSFRDAIEIFRLISQVSVQLYGLFYELDSHAAFTQLCCKCSECSKRLTLRSPGERSVILIKRLKMEIQDGTEFG